ncbi:MAG: AraC family transcriptional regulator [Myxococcales bacterium]|nr:AraC family transcriptional regulator [Myxococcales bacterium]
MRRDSLAAVPMTATYFKLLLWNLGLPRAAVEQALANARLSAASLSDPDREITVGEQLEVFSDLVRRLPPDGWLAAGRRFHVGTHGALGFAFVSAPDVRTSLEILERFGPVRLPYVRARTASRRGGRYSLSLDVTPSVDPAARIAIMELIAVIRKSLLESVAGESIADVTFEFDYAAPSYADAYAAELGVPVRFDCPVTAMTLPEALLARPCATADVGMFAAAVERLEMRGRQLDGASSIVGHVEELLDAAGDAGVPVEEAARILGMSRRSLTRRLTDCGTTYRVLRDRHRRERAELLLRDASLDLGEIAWRLGYRDLANFGRAARRWFGMPPARYRRSLD